MKLRLIRLLIISLAIIICQSIYAQDGEAGYEFLNVSSSSHIYGIGGQNISIIDDDINLVNQNPALLGKEMTLQLGLNYMRYLGGSNFMGATFGLKAHEHGAIALGIQYYGYGEMKSADPDGTITGTFSPKDVTFNAMYSHDITDRLRGGINLKVVSSNYERYSSLAICTDLGVNYYNPDNDLSLSLVLRNLGGQVKKFDDTSVSLPWDIQLGWSQSLTNAPIRFSITATNLNRWKLPYYDKEDSNSTSSNIVRKESFGSNLFRHLVFAAEYVPSEKFYIGLGYNYKTRTDMSTYSRNFLSGFSIGAGMKVKMLGFGVSISQPHVGGTTFMFNLALNIKDFLN
ncbi:MAG: type IX secretion system protein PorQ [Muribaculaceae bacterium]|nr:type IX secretion system protein PorQ [Muribaculaceae bacterium]